MKENGSFITRRRSVLLGKQQINENPGMRRLVDIENDSSA
jgi:hypothetical protein